MSSMEFDPAKAPEPVTHEPVVAAHSIKSSEIKETHTMETPASMSVTSKADISKKLLWKIDLYLMVPFVFLNFLSLMGRTNIGAALVQQLPVDLHLDAMSVFLAVAIPGVPLILFEIPSNLLMKWLETRFNFSYMRYLSAITIGLGMLYCANCGQS